MNLLRRLFGAHHRRIIWAAMVLVFTSNPSLGFDDQYTPLQLTERGIAVSNLATVLKSTLGITDGINATLTDPTYPLSVKSRSIIRWLQAGSTREDRDHFCRASNHVHNPLQPYPSAGITDVDGYVVEGDVASEYSGSAIWGRTCGGSSPLARS